MIAAILGGGPSLPEDLKSIPKEAVLFGVNGHASKIIDCDYIVFNDYHGGVLFKGLKGKKICRFREYADIYQDCEKGLISGVVALRYALAERYSPIILAGFDCYQQGGYFHDNTQNERAKLFTLEHHLSYWPPHNDVYAVSGPLLQIYKKARKNMKSDKEFIEITVTKAKTVVLDERRHCNFVKGKQTVSREKALAAIKAKIATTKEKI